MPVYVRDCHFHCHITIKTPLRQRDPNQRFLSTCVGRSLIDDDEDEGAKSGGAKSGQRILDSEIQTPTGAKSGEANSGQRIRNSEIQTPTLIIYREASNASVVQGEVSFALLCGWPCSLLWMAIFSVKEP